MAMQLIALFILIISLKTTFVSSTECENATGKCIQLCCEIEQTYKEDIEECYSIPKYATPLWIALMRNMSKAEEVNFVENDDCVLLSEHSVIHNCFSPYYERDADGNITVTLKEFSKVPCERFPADTESSYECENPNVKCHELCCEMEQTYVEKIKECHNIPKYARSEWLALISNMTKTGEVSFIQNTECLLFAEHSGIQNCFSPYYERDAYGYITVTLKEYSKVPCKRFSDESESSGECKNTNDTCIDLCCQVGQTYVERRKECLDIPNLSPLWFSLMRNISKTEEVNFVENDDCLLYPVHSVIDNCFSPYYERDADGYITVTLKEYSKVPCDRYPTDTESSSECENSNVTCHELCCEMGQKYVENIGECHNMPEHAKSEWFALISNMTKTGEVSFIQNTECLLFDEDSVINNCFAPYYEKDADGYILKEYFDVPCERFLKGGLYLGNHILLILPLCMPIFLIFAWTKKNKKNNLSYRLITWYLMSVTTAGLTLGLEMFVYIHSQVFLGFALKYLDFLTTFFLTSTHLWLGCIGYYVYVQFKEANDQSTIRKDRMRFIWLSVYVWIGTLTINIVYRMVKKTDFVDGPVMLIAYFNVVGFLVFSLKICLIRSRVIGISTEKHIKCKLLRTICRLCILMGVPRNLMLIFEPAPIFGIDPMTIMFFLEPYLVYGNFVAENKNWFILLRKKCCCSQNQNVDIVQDTDDRVISGTTSV